MHGSGSNRFLSPLGGWCITVVTDRVQHLPQHSFHFTLYAMLLHMVFVPFPRNLSCQKHEDDPHAGGLGLSDCSLSSSPMCSLICQDVIVSGLIKSFPRSQRAQRRRKGGIFLPLEAVTALNSTDKNFVQAVHLSSLRSSENSINSLHLPNTTWPQDCNIRNATVAIGKTAYFRTALFKRSHFPK